MLFFRAKSQATQKKREILIFITIISNYNVFILYWAITSSVPSAVYTSVIGDKMLLQ